MKRNLLFSVGFILTISVILKYLPYIKKYNIKIRFNIYRSLMCTFFVIKSLEYLKNKPVIFGNYFQSNAKLSSLFYLFLSYLILDILYVIATSIKQKNLKRLDLMVHHLVIVTILITCYRKKLLGDIFPILLLNEAISIVSGFDCAELSKSNYDISIIFKKIRKIIILFIRLPIWSGLLYLLVNLQNDKNSKINNTMIILIIIIDIIMLSLDYYWFNKCNKFIDKYSNLTK